MALILITVVLVIVLVASPLFFVIVAFITVIVHVTCRTGTPLPHRAISASCSCETKRCNDYAMLSVQE